MACMSVGDRHIRRPLVIGSEKLYLSEVTDDKRSSGIQEFYIQV